MLSFRYISARSVNRYTNNEPAPPPNEVELPPEYSTFYWQLQGTVPTNRAETVYDIDGFDNAKSVFDTLNVAGKYTIAYFSAGTWEPGRPDSGSFPSGVKGNAVPGWETERWLDVRAVATLQPIMEARADIAVTKGAKAIEWDNLDGYDNNPGFSISQAQQKTYLTMLADITHARGLACIFKNVPQFASWAAPIFDGCICEEAYEWTEIADYMPFRNANKPVWAVEYTGTLNCSDAQSRGIYLAKFPLDLDGPPTSTCSIAPPSSLLGTGSVSTSEADYPRTGSVTSGNYYVDGTSGNDSNGGTSLGSAKKTIAAAITAASSGQTIIVRGGTYALTSALAVSKQVNIYGYGTERWVIDRANGGTTSGVNHAGIRITANGAKIKGFGVKGVPTRSDADYATYAVEVVSGTSNVVIEDGVIWGGKSGSVMLYQCSNPLVMDVITIGSSGAGSASNMPDGIVATANSGQATTNATIVRCLAANIGDDCFDLFRATGAKIIDCVAISAGTSHTGASLGDGNGYKMGGTGSGNNTLRGSISIYAKTTGITNNANAGSAGLFINNTAAHNARGLLSDDGTAPVQTNNIALNNTVYNTSVAGTQNNNTWNLSISNASFAAIASGDWSLGSGSSCIGVGTSGANLGASTVALELLKKWWNHSLIWVTGRGAGPGGTGLPGDS